MSDGEQQRFGSQPTRGKRGARAEPAADGGESDRSRQRIHRAALARFARYGYEAVSLQQIADDVGLHKSSLFHHYSAKAELLREVFREVMNGVLSCLRPLQSDAPPTCEALFEVLDTLVDHFCDTPQAARLVLAVMTAPEDSDLRQHCGPAVAEFYLIVIGYLERARRSEVIRRVNIRQAVPNLIGLVLLYPAAAHDLTLLVGEEPFAPRARQIRKEELGRAFHALFALE